MDQVGDGGSGTAVSRLAAVPSRDLQAALAQIDVRDLGGADIGLVTQARARLLAWVQAESAVDVTESAHCLPSTAVPTARTEAVQEFACDEVALLLHVAPMTGKHLVLDAVDLVQRHPRLWSALSDGLIDLRKVKAVTTLCPDTDNELAAALDDVLLSTAVRADGTTALEQTIAETPRVLGRRAQRILSALDPSWTRAIRRETLGRRRLVKGTYSTGIGYLGLYDIGVPGMAGAYEHVNAIARGIKRLGDPRTLDQLRADTALDLLTGGTSPLHPTTPTGKTRTTPRAKPAKDQDRPDEPAGDTAHADPQADGASEADSPIASHTDAAVAPTSEERLEDATGSADHAGDAGSHTDPDPVATTAQTTTEDLSENAGARTERAVPEADTSQPEAKPKAEPEPPIPAPYPVPRARADVDLIVHINTLANLADALRRGELIQIGGYGLVPADVAARLVKAAAARPSTWCMTVIDDTGRVIEHVRTHHDPTKAMREFVNARDRHCRFPGCTVTAVRCDQDHTKSWETGGATCPCNLTPLCRRHHRLKQAQGFDLSINPDTNTATWTTPHTAGTNAPPWKAPGYHDLPPPF